MCTPLSPLRDCCGPSAPQDQADPIDFSSASILQSHSKKMALNLTTFYHSASSHHPKRVLLMWYLRVSSCVAQRFFLPHVYRKRSVFPRVVFRAPPLIWVMFLKGAHLKAALIFIVSRVHTVPLCPSIHQSAAVFVSAGSSLWSSPSGRQIMRMDSLT